MKNNYHFNNYNDQIMQYMVSTKLDNTIVKYFHYFFNRKLEVIV